LVVLAETLFPATEETPSACPVPTAIRDFLQEAAQKLSPEGDKSPLAEARIAELFTTLNTWSRTCWVHLGAASPLLSEAATLGGSLADTYWAMQLPPDAKSPVQEDTRVKAQTWRGLLAPNRLHALIEDVYAVEAQLPADVGSVLRHTLWEWGIADDLTRDDAGHLQIADPSAWRRLTKRHRREVKELQPEEERALYAHLEDQQRQWRRLVFAGDVALEPTDRRHLRLLAGLCYILEVVTLFILTVLALLGLSWLAYQIGVWLFPQIQRPDTVEDWLKIGGALTAVATFVGTQLWRWGKMILNLYDEIADWWRVVKEKQRSLRPWNGKPKAAWLIALQQLVYPKAR
jgi:hypothetical protein